MLGGERRDPLVDHDVGDLADGRRRREARGHLLETVGVRRGGLRPLARRDVAGEPDDPPWASVLQVHGARARPDPADVPVARRRAELDLVAASLLDARLDGVDQALPVVRVEQLQELLEALRLRAAREPVDRSEVVRPLDDVCPDVPRPAAGPGPLERLAEEPLARGERVTELARRAQARGRVDPRATGANRRHHLRPRPAAPPSHRCPERTASPWAGQPGRARHPRLRRSVRDVTARRTHGVRRPRRGAR